jgi:hypothetical protein
MGHPLHRSTACPRPQILTTPPAAATPLRTPMATTTMTIRLQSIIARRTRFAA